MDVVVPVKCVAVETHLRLRVVSSPEAALTQLLAHMGLQLPKGARQITNVVPKISH
jgi:hypothetical protein